MDPALLARGFALGFVIAAGIGPISLLVIRRTLAEGRVVGLVSGLGVATADGTYGGIAAFGLTAITDALVGSRRLLALVGGIFLLWLAWQALRSRPATAATVRDRPRGLIRTYLAMVGLTLANPMTILSFGALFAGSGVTGSNPAESALITLGVFAGSSTWWVVLTTVVALLRSRVTARWLRTVTLVSAAVIALLAIVSIVAAIRG